MDDDHSNFQLPSSDEEIRTRARWYAQLLETTRDAVICIDRRGNIVLFNQAAERMFGYDAPEILGQNVKVLMAMPYAAEHDGYVERYEQTREPQAIGRIRTVAARRSNGEIFPIELSVTEVAVGERARYGAFIRDISDKVSLQERLLERERLAAVGTTAASFAHEVGNPLNGMYMHAQLLERRLGKSELGVDPKIGDSMSSLLAQTQRLRHLLDEFRSLARRPQFSVTPTDLVTVVRDVVSAETPALNIRGIQARLEVPPQLRAIFIDTEKLRQVLLNLIKNAADAMPEGGTLTVRVIDSPQRVRIEVQDEGSGIPEGIEPFEPFVTSKTEGTGLGLPVALQIVQAHGGTLTYEPAPTRGTRFVLELPRRDDAREV
ncbi:MAG: PAS domain S-box protein [Myxococcota bacterium]